jgi:DNA-directed RNA polymerase specialized sigma24 family protein
MAALCGPARHKLGGTSRRATDEEDVVLNAFNSFFQRAKERRFARLSDRNDLWQLLVLLTERQAVNQMRHEGRQKRGGGKVLGESALPGDDDANAGPTGMAQMPFPEPTPEFAAEVAEEFQRLLGYLDDDLSRQIALWKMEGYTNDEIAARIGKSTRTVERRLELIRRRWEEQAT